MEVDHLFIFSDQQGSEADELLRWGLTEGSSRRHPGQGTRNRKFYFENFFLEILWVVDQEEIDREPAASTGLGDRARFVTNGSSRFGLCLLNTEATDALFRHSEPYQPEYFPVGMSVDILPHHDNPLLPWTFRLPYRGEKKPTLEPTHHSSGVRRLTKAVFGVPGVRQDHDFVRGFAPPTTVAFENSERPVLLLEFDGGQQHQTKRWEALDLTFVY